MGYFWTRELKNKFSFPTNFLPYSFLKKWLNPESRDGDRRRRKHASLKPQNHHVEGMKNKLLMCYTLSVFYCCATGHSQTQRLKITAITDFTHKSNLARALTRQLSLASHGISWDRDTGGPVSRWASHRICKCLLGVNQELGWGWGMGASSSRPRWTLHGLRAFLKAQNLDSKSKCTKRQSVEADTFFRSLGRETDTILLMP